jgi:hypothetical protein
MSDGCGDFVDGEWCELVERYEHQVLTRVLELLEETGDVVTWEDHEQARQRLHGLFGAYR